MSNEHDITIPHVVKFLPIIVKEIVHRNINRLPAFINRSKIVNRQGSAESLGIECKRLMYKDKSKMVKKVYLDIKDIINYVEGGNVTVSGIQRVVANLFLFRKLSGHEIIPIIPEYDKHRILSPSIESTEYLFSELQSGTSSSEELMRALSNVYESRIEIFPQEDDIYFLAGAFWIIDCYDIFISIKSKGAKIVLFLHDLIQINNPEYVSSHANLTFTKSFLDIIQICDKIITNSNFVAKDVLNFQLINFGDVIDVEPVSLPTEVPNIQEDITRLRKEVSALHKEEFVLYVGTIEIRKNHIYLVQVWERLLSEGFELPKLVFAGKWGWKISNLKEYLNETNYLDGKICVLNNLSDQEIAFLYKNCLFTVYTSYAEGFGLPIAESLFYKKFCIASSTTSMPEVGGNFCEYVDPFNIEDGYEKIRNIFLDKKSITIKEDYIKNNFKPRSWQEFCTDIYETLNDNSLISRKLPNFRFNSGELYNFGNNKSAFKIVPSIRMTRGCGWDMTDAGIVSSNFTSALTIPTKFAVEKIDIYFLLSSAIEPSVSIEIKINDKINRIIVEREITLIKLVSDVDESGIINVSISPQNSDNYKLDENRVLLAMIGFAKHGNLSDVISVLEKITAAGIIGKVYDENKKSLSFHSTIEDSSFGGGIYHLLSYDGPRLIELTYQVILGRSCDEGGMMNYLKKLSSGQKKIEFIREILLSEESREKNPENKLKLFHLDLEKIT
jgi:glycosyltransferase involved in cell wall biosynthesis